MTDIRLACTMLIGGSREALVQDAWGSVADIADALVAIDTGESAQKAIEVVRTLLPPERLHVVKYTVKPVLGSDGRNFCLAQAHRLGFTHAIILDTDERLHANGVDVRAEILKLDTDVILTMDDGGEYPKARFIRLPAVGGYRDRTHEIYVGADSLSLMQGVTFSEIPKTPEQQEVRMGVIRDVCLQWILDEPGYARAWLHLANTHVYFKKWPEALTCFLRTADLTEYDEERAWALYRAAGCHEELEEYKQTIELCSLGMAACPYFPELPYLAAWASAKLGRHFDALAWANVAIANGKMSSVPVVTPLRAGFQIPIAHFEGPWDIRAATLEAMGLDKLAEQARGFYERAKLRGRAAA